MPKFREWIASRSAAALASSDELYVRDASGDVSQRTTYGALTAVADAHIADTTDAHDASAISILDTAGNYAATDVEGALAELPSQYLTIADAVSALYFPGGGANYLQTPDDAAFDGLTELELIHRCALDDWDASGN